MRKTTCYNVDASNKILLNTIELQSLLSCGRQSAVKIGTDAMARVDVGKRVFWDRKKVELYISEISV